MSLVDDVADHLLVTIYPEAVPGGEKRTLHSVFGQDLQNRRCAVEIFEIPVVIGAVMPGKDQVNGFFIRIDALGYPIGVFYQFEFRGFVAASGHGQQADQQKHGKDRFFHVVDRCILVVRG